MLAILSTMLKAEVTRALREINKPIDEELNSATDSGKGD